MQDGAIRITLPKRITVGVNHPGLAVGELLKCKFHGSIP